MAEPPSSKRCPRCAVVKSLEEFAVRRRSPDGRQAYCRECSNAAGKERYLGSAVRATYRRRGLTKRGANLSGIVDSDLTPPDNYECPVCGRNSPAGRGSWHLDHDHSTGAIRSWLCHHCNTGLGHFKDSPEILAAGIAYLCAHGQAVPTEKLVEILQRNTDEEKPDG